MREGAQSLHLSNEERGIMVIALQASLDNFANEITMMQQYRSNSGGRGTEDSQFWDRQIALFRTRMSKIAKIRTRIKQGRST